MIVPLIALIIAVIGAVLIVKFITTAEIYLKARGERKAMPTYVPTAWEHEEVDVYRDGYTNYEDDGGTYA